MVNINKEYALARMRFIVDTFVKVLDLPVVIAGGSCRDVYHGVWPKDYDVFIYGKYDKDAIIKKLETIGGDFIEKYGEGRGNTEFDGVVKMHLNNSAIDLIFHNRPIKDVRDLLLRFDSNINYFYYNYEQNDIGWIKETFPINPEFTCLDNADEARLRDILIKTGYKSFEILDNDVSPKVYDVYKSLKVYEDRKARKKAFNADWFVEAIDVPNFNMPRVNEGIARQIDMARDLVDAIDEDLKKAKERAEQNKKERKIPFGKFFGKNNINFK